jgi:hypothetical protein
MQVQVEAGKRQERWTSSQKSVNHTSLSKHRRSHQHLLSSWPRVEIDLFNVLFHAVIELRVQGSGSST